MTETTSQAGAQLPGYEQKFAVLAGYLPQDREHLDGWLHTLADEVAAARQNRYDPTPRHPSVVNLEQLIESDPITRMYLTEMIDQVPKAKQTVHSIDQLLDSLDYIIGRAPKYNPDPKKRHFFPMSALFVYMMYTPAGEAAFRYAPFNSCLREILQAWCSYLDSPASRDVLNTGEYGWLSPSAWEYNDLDIFVVDKNAPHGGFDSFNAYFHRQIRLEYRPVAYPDDPKAIVSANDGTVFQIARNVQRSDRFWLKSQPYSLADMLGDSALVYRFISGDVFQSFLSGANYHRWRAPIDGVVRDARVLPGLMFSELHSQGFDPDAGVLSQGYEASVNTRGLVFIESDDPVIGMVCVIPIGITEISSISIQVRVGQRVRKGDELGYFSYGGSTLALVFQPGAIDHYTVTAPHEGKPGEPIDVNALIAWAK